MKTTVVCVPELQIRLFGFPPMVKVTPAERAALILIHRGGMGALRSNGHKTACKTIDSMVCKELLGRDGLTALGECVAESLSDEDHYNTIGNLEG